MEPVRKVQAATHFKQVREDYTYGSEGICLAVFRLVFFFLK